MRVGIGNIRTTEQHLDVLWDEVRRAARATAGAG